MKRLLVGFVALGLLLGACGDDDAAPASGGEFSVLAALGEVPAGVERLIEVGDIAAALELAEITRPDARDGDSVGPWVSAVTGGPSPDGVSPVMVPIPSELGRERLPLTDEFHDELGWSLVDVDWFVGAGQPPLRFVVAGGQFGDEALAGLPEVADGVVTAGEGDDYSMDNENRTAARILGDPLRLARVGDRIALSKSTPLVRTWLDGGATMADDPDLAAVARTLDDVGVVGAFLYGLGGEGAAAPTLGIGWNLGDDGNAVVTVVYRFAEEVSVDEVRTAWEDVLDQPQIWGPELVDVSVDGESAVVTLRVVEGSPTTVLSMLIRRELPFGP